MTATSLFLLASALVLVNGYTLEERVKRESVTPTDDQCIRPPMKRLARECCRLPRERIWGDLRDSLNVCIKKFKHGRRAAREMADEDRPSPMTPPVHFHRRNNTLSERVRETLKFMFKVVKNTLDGLWQSVVMITDHPHHHHPNDSCFMECVFEDQGFLMDKMVNKAALLERLNQTLGRNEMWHKVATAAVETCHENEMEAPSNSTCQSGSEGIFRCVFKQIFFNCPTWPQTNDYCSALREFYQKCPNGPPPDINDNHSTMSPEDEVENEPTTERSISI